MLREKIRGGQILDLLVDKKNCGNEYLSKTYDLLISNCFLVFYGQLSCWILYGVIEDHYNEFFIYKYKSEQQPEFDHAELENDEENMNDWDLCFSVRYSMIPKSIISTKLAEKILFIGKVINNFY